MLYVTVLIYVMTYGIRYHSYAFADVCCTLPSLESRSLRPLKVIVGKYSKLI